MDGALKQLVENLKPVQDQSTIDHRLIAQGMNTIAQARQRSGLVREHFEALPADGQGLRPAVEELEQAMASVAASETVLTPIHKKLSALINPASYPNLTVDTERLRDLAGMYANPNLLVQDREQAAALIIEAQAAWEEHQRLIKQYATLIHQRTEEGERLESISRHFVKQFNRFAAAAQQQKAVLPGQIQADVDRATAMVSEATAKKNPLFFTGGIPQQLDMAGQKLALYIALDPQGAHALQRKINQMRQGLKQQQAALKDQIIESNELPPDRYTGSDRDAVSKIATEAWKIVQRGAKLLAIRIPSQGWKREVMWRNQTGSWYKIDRSKLQVQLIVKHDDKLAVVRPIDLWKNHLSSDQIKAFPFHEKDAELQPQEFLLLEKVK